jgi:hypothetical protein
MENSSYKLSLKPDKKTWYPQPITTLESHLKVLIKKGTLFPDEKISPLTKNLAYNLQYIEFLDRLMKDVNLSSVLWTQNVKTFVVNSAAVIEGVFQYIVVSKGYASTTIWQSCKKFKSNEYEIDGNTFLQETEMFLKISLPIIKEMTFDQLAKKIEDKKLLGDVNDLYKAISRLRKLRNKIHIHEINGSEDTDYNNFNDSECKLARKVLFGVLTCPLFEESSYLKCFDYLINNDNPNTK